MKWKKCKYCKIKFKGDVCPNCGVVSILKDFKAEIEKGIKDGNGSN